MREPPTPIEGGAALADWRRQLGEQRLAAVVEAQGNLHAQMMFLTMALPGVGMAGYTDEAIRACEQDVRDMERAATNLATVTRQVLDEWKQQRRRAEREARRR